MVFQYWSVYLVLSLHFEWTVVLKKKKQRLRTLLWIDYRNALRNEILTSPLSFLQTTKVTPNVSGKTVRYVLLKGAWCFIHTCKVPQKIDCMRCINMEPYALKDQTWTGVKNYIRNRIAALKREACAQDSQQLLVLYHSTATQCFLPVCYSIPVCWSIPVI